MYLWVSAGYYEGSLLHPVTGLSACLINLLLAQGQVKNTDFTL